MTKEQTGNIPGHEAQPTFYLAAVTGKGKYRKNDRFQQYTECLRKNSGILVINICSHYEIKTLINKKYYMISPSFVTIYCNSM
jgi:metal-dependent hydrolase (beta-lactamase superfamily II)